MAEHVEVYERTTERMTRLGGELADARAAVEDAENRFDEVRREHQAAHDHLRALEQELDTLRRQGMFTRPGRVQRVFGEEEG